MCPEAIFATLRDRTFEDREAAVRSATARALGRVAIAAFNTDESLAERCVAALSEKGPSLLAMRSEKVVSLWHFFERNRCELGRQIFRGFC